MPDISIVPDLFIRVDRTFLPERSRILTLYSLISFICRLSRLFAGLRYSLMRGVLFVLLRPGPYDALPSVLIPPLV